MFFPRLRRSAKWAFVFLAVVFGLGFVVFGVGSGLPSGVGDIIRFQGGSSGRPSVSEAEERVRENPSNPTAYRELATALRLDGRDEEAVAPLERYVGLRPNDRGALAELASLYGLRARRLEYEAQLAQLEAQGTLAGPTLAPGLQVGGQALAQDAITRAVVETLNARLSRTYSTAQDAFRKAQQTYEKIAALASDDPDVQLQLAQAAENAGDTQAALAAFRRFLELAPDDRSAPLVRQEIKRLEAARAGAPSG